MAKRRSRRTRRSSGKRCFSKSTGKRVSCKRQAAGRKAARKSRRRSSRSSRRRCRC